MRTKEMAFHALRSFNDGENYTPLIFAHFLKQLILNY